MPTNRCGTWPSLWSSFALGCVGLLLISYGGLLASTAIYLGWHDAGYFFTHSRIWSRLFLTLWTAALSTVLSMVLAIPAGYALSRLSPPFPHLLNTVIDLPVMVPPAAVGVFLLGAVHTFPVGEFCSLLGLEFSHHTAGVILCQVTVTAAFAVRLCKAAFDAVPTRFEAVARSLGASWPTAARTITLPLAKRGLIAALLVVFARAAAEWEALMLFVGATQGTTDTLPFAVYLDWNGGLMGWVASMSLLCVLMSIAVMGAVRFLEGRTHVW